MVAVPETQDAVVEAVGLTKIFRDFWGRPKARAVNGIDLSVKRGQVFGLLGPNGSGKSTTVKLILGLLYPTRGSLKVLNESPQNVKIKQRIGYLPEESYLYRYLTAAETLDFFGALFGLVPRERQHRTDQLLGMVGLGNARNRPVGEFSKGMARRIGLAQALINDPDLVILDEPTAGLDPIGCREVKDVIRLLASRGKTVLLCSHLLADVEDVCDEVLVLYGGKVRTQGNLTEILKVQDKTRIVSPRLDEAAVSKVVELLGQQVDKAEIAVDQPTMNLETFFLDVVRRAREASLDTAGAQSGGEIAEYLRGAADDTPADAARRVLEALEKGREVVAEPEEERAAEEPAPSTPAVDNTRLAELAGSAAEAIDDAAEEDTRETQEKTGGTARLAASKRLADMLGQELPAQERPEGTE